MHHTKFCSVIPLLLLTLFTGSVQAAEWTIATIAGTGVQGFTGDGGPATAAQIDNPYGVVRGPDGALWFCEYSGQRIRRIAPDGTISTIAGTGQRGYTGDGGPALAATFNLPHELRFDAAGNIFVADMSNHAIRRIDAKTKVIRTFAGTGQRGYAGDGGPADKAALNQPHSIQFGPDGSLYICDISNHAIRRVDMTSGIISTFAGTGRAGATPDGAPIKGTPLREPRTLEFDKAGNLWLADTETHSVRMIDAKTGNLELIAGTGTAGNGTDSDPLKCALNRLHGIYVDHDGSILVGDSEAHRVRVLRKKNNGHGYSSAPTSRRYNSTPFA